jgi:hypothetical protein
MDKKLAKISNQLDAISNRLENDLSKSDNDDICKRTKIMFIVLVVTTCLCILGLAHFVCTKLG